MAWLIPVDLQTYAFAFAAVLAAAMVQGSTGLGFGMVAAPILAIVDPVFVPGPLLVLALLVSMMVAVREWQSVDRAGVGFALAGRIPASFAAGFTVALIPASAFGVLFGVLVLLAVLLSVAGWRLLPTRPNLVMAGLVSGYMGTITSIGAPPMALVYQNRSGPEVRATLGAFFVFGALWSLIALGAFGALGQRDLQLSANLLPAMILGFFASNWVVAHIDKNRVRQLVLTICALSAIALLAKSLL